MDLLLRVVAIVIELLILLVLAYCVLNGVRLTVFDLGIKPKYGKAIAMVLLAGGFIILVFFVAHLTTFYPSI